MLPFTHEEFIAVFRVYNTAIWPAQVVAYLVGATVVLLLMHPTPWADRNIAAILGLMWLWTGLAARQVLLDRLPQGVRNAAEDRHLPRLAAHRSRRRRAARRGARRLRGPGALQRLAS